MEEKIKMSKEQEKQVKDATKKLKELNAPRVAKDISLREREVDIRELSDKDLKQLFYRNSGDIVGYLKLFMETLIDMQLEISVIIEKMYKDSGKEVDGLELTQNRLLEYEEKLKNLSKHEN